MEILPVLKTEVRGEQPSALLVWTILLLSVSLSTVIVVWCTRRHYLRRGEYLMHSRRRYVQLNEAAFNNRRTIIEGLKEERVPVETAEELCAICLTRLGHAKWSVSRGLNCDHFLHSDCYRMWLSKDAKCACPICRRAVFEKESSLQ